MLPSNRRVFSAFLGLISFEGVLPQLMRDYFRSLFFLSLAYLLWLFFLIFTTALFGDSADYRMTFPVTLS